LEEVRSLLSVTSNDNKTKPGLHPRARKKSVEPDEMTLDEKHVHDTVIVNVNDHRLEEEKQASDVKDHSAITSAADNHGHPSEGTE
jgi:hypothetical protein